MNKVKPHHPKAHQWKLIEVVDEGRVINKFELNDQEKLIKKFPKMKPRKLIFEMPKLSVIPSVPTFTGDGPNGQNLRNPNQVPNNCVGGEIDTCSSFISNDNKVNTNLDFLFHDLGNQDEFFNDNFALDQDIGYYNIDLEFLNAKDPNYLF